MEAHRTARRSRPVATRTMPARAQSASACSWHGGDSNWRMPTMLRPHPGRRRAHDDRALARRAGRGGGRAEAAHDVLGVPVRDGRQLPRRQQASAALGDARAHRAVAAPLPRSACPIGRASSLTPAYAQRLTAQASGGWAARAPRSSRSRTAAATIPASLATRSPSRSQNSGRLGRCCVAGVAAVRIARRISCAVEQSRQRRRRRRRDLRSARASVTRRSACRAPGRRVPASTPGCRSRQRARACAGRPSALGLHGNV